MVPRSLRSLTAVFLLTFLLATLGTGFAIHHATLSTIERLVDRRIAAVNDGVADAAHSRRELLDRIDLATRQRDTGDIGFVLLDEKGRRVGGNVALRRQLPLGFSTLRDDDRIVGLSAGRALVRRIGGGMTLVTIAETEPFDHYNAKRDRIYLIGFGSIIAAVVAGLVAFGLLIRRRIGEMRRTVDAIIDGDMQHRVPVDPSGGTFAEQAQAFNRMLDRIAALMAGIGSISNDIAHDLRTPLARLRSRLGLSLRRAKTPEQVREIEEAIALSDDLLAMFAAILRIAEVEGSDRRAAFAPVDLAGLADEIAAMLVPVIADSGRVLAVGPLPPLTIVGDRHMLGQALINLIENAMRHTPVGTRIAIRLEPHGTVARVIVADDGPGIAVDDRALALRRFGQVDTSRHDGGHGLGLPLVEAIVRLHRGSLALEDAAPGLRVVMDLPAG
ncbi:sensor histidine kinase [Sphingomonas sp. R86521]|uniref:sensor histidine kinase n=1 Tax=Sphingomonas sp. R86521 TaxID=3093860 RepID=UPI0036D35560